MAADPWDTHAGWWKATVSSDPEYTEQILPMVEAHLDSAIDILDVGTGEGLVARRAAAGRRRVVGVDTSGAQLRNATEAGAGPKYAEADAVALPVRTGSFDAVVACLVLQHIERPEDAIAEAARALRPGGRLLLFLNHPLLQAPGSGWIDDHILGEQYWRVGRYLVDDTSMQEVDKDVVVPFVHRPLSHYVQALAACGLRISSMEEPPPPPGFLSEAPEYLEAATIPRLMFIRAEKAATSNE